ncbi:MAG: huntingtin interacting protein E-like protein [Bacteroidetes bacterium]|nr:huntingtin interacting protein E-like protein [Bacteroidota bacterium]
MFEKEIEQYQKVLTEYRKVIMSRMNAGDWKEYIEILFSAHSCAIEGNTFSVDDTRALKEQGLGMIPVGKTLFEAFEILDHFKAYEFIMQSLQEPLTEQLIKDTHRILTEHTLSYRYKDTAPGEYTDTDMGAGDTIFGDHEKNIARMPALMEATQRAIQKKEIHPIEIAAQFHRHFIFLHPFRDGNGRLGRLFSNFILAKMEHPLIIIDNADRESYINALKQCRDERGTAPMVQYFFATAIQRMEKDIAQKRNNEIEIEF